MELLRAQRERRFRLELHDPQPIERPGDVWALAAQIAIVGVFVLLLIAALYAGRGLLLPIVVAVVIGETLAPLVKGAAERGVPRLLTAALLIAVGLALVGLAVTLLAAPIKELIAQAPEFGASIKDKLYVFDRPLAAWRELQSAVLPPSDSNVVQLDTGWTSFWTSIMSPLVGFLTPALGQIVLFVIVLFFVLAG